MDTMVKKSRVYRYKVTVRDSPKVFFVYGAQRRQARSRLPSSMVVETFELAGFVEDGITYYPLEELRAVTMQDGRAAPERDLACRCPGLSVYH
jgi:hypothetical protein